MCTTNVSRSVLDFFVLMVFLLTPGTGSSQFNFEEIVSPHDFSLEMVRASPVGELFLQSSIYDKVIFTSSDSVNWTVDVMPSRVYLEDLKFFPDGTPMFDQGFRNYIRRSAGWEEIEIPENGTPLYFIGHDTLYYYLKGRFNYSVDKGRSFSHIFTEDEDLLGKVYDFWAFNNNYVIYHRSLDVDFISVFDKLGQQTRRDTLQFIPSQILYTDCSGAFLIGDEQYLNITPDADVLSGMTQEIMPTSDWVDIKTDGRDVLIRTPSALFIMDGCDLNIFQVQQDERYDEYDDYWPSMGSVIFQNRFANKFDVYTPHNNTWEEISISAKAPVILAVNESVHGDQYAITTNKHFRKHLSDSSWQEVTTDSIGMANIQYDINGNLYLMRSEGIWFSEDNGLSFTLIDIPPDVYSSPVLVQENSIVALAYDWIGSQTLWYTLDNGITWSTAELEYFDYLYAPKFAMKDSAIFVANVGIVNLFARLDLASGEVSYADINENNSEPLDIEVTFNTQADIYFIQNHSFYISLYRNQFGVGDEQVATINSFLLTFSVPLLSTSSSIIAIGSDTFYVFNNGELYFHPITLPDNSRRSYSVTSEDILYAIVDEHRIFRTSETVSSSNALNHTMGKVIISPNPSHDKIHITYSNTTGVDRVHILDTRGIVISEAWVQDQRIIEMSIADFTPGHYTLLLMDGTEILAVSRFIKI